MITTKRRTVFNLDTFILDLKFCLECEDKHEDIDDVVQTYKDFLSHIDEDLKVKVKKYMDKRVEIIEDSNLRSFVSACYN